METVTVLTPTYNREKFLDKLYKSLLNQTCKDFLWYIVDDGSEDGTGNCVKLWKKENKISIIYKKKINGGKHTALNLGIAEINTELTFIVDSDDWLPANAIENIVKAHNLYKSKDNLCGYSFLRFYPDGKVNTAYFPENGKIDTYVNVRINGNIGGDKAEVFYTEKLKQFPFPVYQNEKFLPEDLVWVKMSGPYKMVHFNECIYISDYLEGGLTKSGRRMKLHSPLGMMARSEAYLQDPEVNWKTKVKMMLLYQIYGKSAGMKVSELKAKIQRNSLFDICMPFSKVIGYWWRRKYVVEGTKRS